MTSPEDAEELRSKAEALLRRAHTDDAFRERLRNETWAVLEEEGVARHVDRQVLATHACDFYSCVDYTCVVSLCPETCLPGGTVWMPTTIEALPA